MPKPIFLDKSFPFFRPYPFFSSLFAPHPFTFIFWMFYSSPGCTKTSKIAKSYDCSNIRWWWGKWKIFLIFPTKKSSDLLQITTFFGKIRKNLQFPHYWCMLVNHNSFNFKAFGANRDEKASKIFKISFFNKNWLCLFSIKIHYFKQKKYFFKKKG